MKAYIGAAFLLLREEDHMNWLTRLLMSEWASVAVVFLLSFALTVLFCKLAIPFLQKLKFGQVVRNDGPEKHLSKAGTPTMGGVMFVVGSLVVFWIAVGILAAEGVVSLSWAAFLTVSTMGFSLIGFLDDFLKVAFKNPKGLPPRWKIIFQFGLAIVLSIWAKSLDGVGSVLIVPWSGYEWDIGMAYIPVMIFVIIAIINSVNLTDGLDGQSASITLIDVLTYVIIIGGPLITKLVAVDGAGFAMAQQKIMNYLVLRLFLAAFGGSLLAYLVFNVYPARLFMGDTGSFAMGGALAAVAMLSQTILIIPLIGITFVASSVSVILQVGSYKLRNKKRVFLMAPLHHHFELKGYPETKVVEWYRIVTVLACMLALTAY